MERLRLRLCCQLKIADTVKGHSSLCEGYEYTFVVNLGKQILVERTAAYVKTATTRLLQKLLVECILAHVKTTTMPLLSNEPTVTARVHTSSCEDYHYASVVNWTQQILLRGTAAYMKTMSTPLLPTENSKYRQRAHQHIWRLRLHLCCQPRTADTGRVHNRICADYDYTSVIYWRQQVLIESIPVHVRTTFTPLLWTKHSSYWQGAH